MTMTFEGSQLVGAYSPAGFISNRAQHTYDENFEGGRLIAANAESTSDFEQLNRRVSARALGACRSSRSAWSEEEFRNLPTYKMILEPAEMGHWSSIVIQPIGGIANDALALLAQAARQQFVIHT